ncbi:DMT family transporter [Actinophytocola oryzae]|uniref:Drug/metabolite transporter (DMT)-like permease n=1 Tax=Actinophytocola oryzae TaxID=502181 RepID=A0A4R7VD58_9PSEU|nr:DMT family transporter [Actinophytocola oryzae]TDV47054.1 drug/metabolite transporter (DMT)-like permease [Actinophytocola oryzae]
MQLVTTSRSHAVAMAATATSLVGLSVPVTGLLDGYPLLAGQSIRYAIGAACLLCWLVAQDRRVPVPAGRDLVGLGLMVGFGMLGFNAAILVGQRYATPGFIAAMLGASPLVLAIVAPALRGHRPNPAAILGAVTVGLGVVVLSGGGSWHGPGLAFGLLVVVCEAAFTLGGVAVVRRLGAVGASMWSCVFAAVGGAVLATVKDGTAAWPVPTPGEGMAILVLGVLVTTVGFAFWYTGVSVLGADRAGVLTGLMPVAGLVTAVLLGRQPLTLVAACGTAIVALGCGMGLGRGDRSPTV